MRFRRWRDVVNRAGAFGPKEGVGSTLCGMGSLGFKQCVVSFYTDESGCQVEYRLSGAVAGRAEGRLLIVQ